jgi:Mg-chelatase subunit ChlD
MAPGGSEAAVVAFGANPDVAAAPGAAAQVQSNWQSNTSISVDGSATNLESALAVANALPTSGSKRIVVLSDGAENAGSALAQAGHTGVPVDTVPVPGIAAGDLRLDALSGPASLWKGDSAALIATLASPAPAQATLTVTVDGVPITEQTLAIGAGQTNHRLDFGVLEPGFHSIVVTVTVADNAIDPILENDTLPFGVVVRDAPVVLMIADERADSGFLTNALINDGALVTTVSPDRVPTRLGDLAPYDAIVLNNVPASALSIDQVAAIDQAARTYGKGVLISGGTQSYGPGGYAGTGLEQMLPVSVKVTDGAQRPRVALLLIIDRSGSMTYNPQAGVSKLDMAREAAKLALTALADGDQIGVLAFNDRQQWVVPMTPIEGESSRAAINAAIDDLTGDSGTEVYPALQVGLDAIRAVDVEVRHVILLSDGRSRSGTRESYESLIAAAARDRVSVSTLALGDDADIELLQYIAALGMGRFHYTTTPTDIPTVTLAEARAAGSQAVVRGSFPPIQLEPSPIMDPFDPALIPPLDGYNYAETKPDAQAVLVTAREDPLLATWQYGLGRVIAWTADDGTDFAAGLRAWPEYDAFFTSMLRWALPDPDARPVSVTAEQDGGTLRFLVETGAARGEPVDLAGASLTVALPGQEPVQLPLSTAGADRYEATLSTAEITSAFAATVTWASPSGVVSQTQAVVLPPSPELRPSGNGEALLAALAVQTDGEVRSLDDPSGLFDPVEGAAAGTLHTYRPIWRWLLGAGLLMLMLEWSIRLRFWNRIGALFAR